MLLCVAYVLVATVAAAERCSYAELSAAVQDECVDAGDTLRIACRQLPAPSVYQDLHIKAVKASSASERCMLTALLVHSVSQK